MSRQARFSREQVLQQLFSQQPSSEPEEEAEEQDGEADREEDYDTVGDAAADSSSCRAPDRAVRVQGKRGVLLHVRIHAHRHSGVLHTNWNLPF